MVKIFQVFFKHWFYEDTFIYHFHCCEFHFWFLLTILLENTVSPRAKSFQKRLISMLLQRNVGKWKNGIVYACDTFCFFGCDFCRLTVNNWIVGILQHSMQEFVSHHHLGFLLIKYLDIQNFSFKSWKKNYLEKVITV